MMTGCMKSEKVNREKQIISKVNYLCYGKFLTMEDLNRNIILSRLIRNEQTIKQYGVEKVGLFGSFVRDEQTNKSDVDILVEFKKGKASYDNFINLCFLLDSLFQGRKVEVVTTNSLSPYIGPRILKQVEYAAFSS
jgi:uncharacterized protein